MPANLPVVVRLKRNGMVVPIDHLVDVRTYLSLLETSSAVIRFADPTMEMIDSDAWQIGDELLVEVENVATSTRVFDGEVVALGADQRSDSRHEFVVEAMDRSHRLSSSLTPSTYLEQTYSDVVRAIAQKYGLRAECTATTIKHEYLLQTVTDRAFLSFMADDIGFEWFVEGRTLHFRPRPEASGAVEAATLSWNTNLTRFEARANAADVAKQVTVRGWDWTTQKIVEGMTPSATANPTAVGSDSALASSVVRAGVKAFASGAANLAPGVVQDGNEATLRSKAVAADVQASAMRVSGEADATPEIKPGVWVRVQDCGRNMSGRYYITECEHVFGANQPFRTRFKMTGRRAGGLSGRGGGSSPPGFGQTGLVIGVVTNLLNSKDGGAGGRVRVRFPAMPELESAWARVVTLGGGGARGGLEMRPEVNDEVLVGFEHGDLRRPFVIGGLLNKNDGDALGALVDGKVVNRGMRSRTGNSIVMFDGDNDAAGGRHITFTTADTKSTVRVGEDRVVIKSAAGTPIELVSGEASIKIDNGAITITGKSFAVKAQQGSKVEGMTVDLKGTNAVAIDGGAKLEAKGAMVSVTASGIAAVKGSMLKLN